MINAYMSLLSLRSQTRWKNSVVGKMEEKFKEEARKNEEKKKQKDANKKEEEKKEEDEGMKEEVDDSEDEVADSDGEVDEQPSASKRERRLAKGAVEEDENMTERRRGKEEEGKNEKGKGKEGEAAPKRCAFFSSFFYALLRNAKNGYSHENVRRWSRKKVRVPYLFAAYILPFE